MTIFRHPFSVPFWREAAGEVKQMKKLTFAALMIALCVMLGYVPSVPLWGGAEITWGFLARSVCAWVCGPVLGAVFAVAEDLLSFFLTGGGGYPFFPGYTLTTVLGVLIYALFFYRQEMTIRRIFLAKLVTNVQNVLLGALWAFRYGRKKFPYHNLPQLFCAQESGMLGIPLFMILFGADQAYRMGILDLTQSVVAIPVIAILSSDAGENPSASQVVKKVMASPLMIMSLLGLALNISGVGRMMDNLGVLPVVTETTGFLSQPISALMLFSVGYNFSLSKGSRKAVFQIAILHFLVFALAGLMIQGLLFLVPGVDSLTRWAIFLFTVLPGSYLAPSLGRNEEEYRMASGVCSILTLVTLAIVCVMAAIVV